MLLNFWPLTFVWVFLDFTLIDRFMTERLISPPFWISQKISFFFFWNSNVEMRVLRFSLIFVQLSLYSLIHSSLHSCIFYLVLFRTSLLFQRKHDCMGIAVRFFFLLHPVRLFIQTNFAKKEKKNCICASIIPSKKLFYINELIHTALIHIHHFPLFARSPINNHVTQVWYYDI